MTRKKSGMGGHELTAWLKERGLTRAAAAELCGVKQGTFDRYCLPLASKGSISIPLVRWELLNLKVSA